MQFAKCLCQPMVVYLFSELTRSRAESQMDNQSQNWSQSGHRPQQGTQGEPGGPPPTKRLKPSPESQQQLSNSTSGPSPSLSHMSSSSSNNPHPKTSPSSNLSRQNAPVPRSNPSQSQRPSSPVSHLQARLGGLGRGTRWSLRQTLGQRSLARRILGKERLAIHLHQRALSDRGGETELLSYEDNTDDLQVRRTILLDCKPRNRLFIVSFTYKLISLFTIIKIIMLFLA